MMGGMIAPQLWRTMQWQALSGCKDFNAISYSWQSTTGRERYNTVEKYCQWKQVKLKGKYQLII